MNIETPGFDDDQSRILWLIPLSFLWLGFILGISFLEAPLKFQAQGVTLSIGLAIGQLVFGALNKIEIGLGLISLFLIWRTNLRWRGDLAANWAFGFGPIYLILLVQSIWLLPILDERAVMIIGGQTPEEAPFHLVYVALEVIKAISLLSVGGLGIKFYQRSIASRQALTSFQQNRNRVDHQPYQATD